MTGRAPTKAPDEGPDWLDGLPSYQWHDARIGGTAVQRRTGTADPKYVWDPALGEHRQADLAYGLDLVDALGEAPFVVITEGAKAAAAVTRAGLDAVGLVSASTIPSEFVIAGLAGRTIVLWPDNDGPGRALMGRVGRLLDAESEAIHVVRWDDAPDHGDAADCSPERASELVADAMARVPVGGRAWRDIAERWPDAEMLSPEPMGEASGRNLAARFRGADELVAELPPAIEWEWRLFIARGAVTELVGRAKAAGKTTLLGHLIEAKLDGRPFLDEPTSAGPVVLLTEQPPASLRAVLERTGLAKRADLRILLWRDARDLSWGEIVAGAIAECERAGATLLVVDTLPAFAGIRGDSENDAGAALAAIEPLQAAAAHGLAVLVVRHERKGGGEVGDSARGSSAFTGAVDVVLRLGREANPVRPTIRTLSTLSRFDETPAELVIELTDHGYIALGDQTAVALDEATRGVLDVVPEAPADGLTETEIIDLVGGRKSTVGVALRTLLAAGQVARTGEGRRGSPFSYTRVPTDPGFVSPAPSGRGGGRKQSQPASVGDRQAAIFHPADDIVEADDELEPDVVEAAIAELFPMPGEARA